MTAVRKLMRMFALNMTAVSNYIDMTKSERTKKKILDTSLTLFKEKGVQKSSVNEIVKRLGIAKGTFFYYYPQKEDLVLEIIDKEFNNYFSEPINIASKNDLNAISKLQSVMLSLFSGFNNTSTLQEIFKLGVEAQYQHYINELRLKTIVPIITKIIDQGNEEQNFKVTNAAFTATIITRGITSYIHSIYALLGQNNIYDEFLCSLEDLLNNALNTTNPISLKH